MALMLVMTIALAVVKLVLCNDINGRDTGTHLDMKLDINKTVNEYNLYGKFRCVMQYASFFYVTERENNFTGEGIKDSPNCKKINWEKIGHNCSVTNDFQTIKYLKALCDSQESIWTYDKLNYIEEHYTNLELQISSGFMKHKYAVMLEVLTRMSQKVIEQQKAAMLVFESVYKALGRNFSYISKMNKDLLQKEELLLNFNKMKLKAKTNTFYRVQTPILVIMLFLGLIGNSLLVTMFVRHAELRTSQNILIINLVISDLLNLIINLMFNYVLNINHIEHFWNSGHGTCRTTIQFLYTSVGLSTWSVVALSVQRFFVIMMPLRSHTSKNCLSEKQLTLIYVISVWVLAIGLALPSSVPSEMDYFGYCSTQLNAKFLTLWNLMWYSLLPPVIVAVNYTLTAWRLAAEIKNLPEQAETQRRGRRRSAYVLLALTVVFMVSYLPLFLYFFLETWGIIYPSLKTSNLLTSESEFIVGSIFRLFFFANSALNPIALFVSSNVFRKYLKLYCHCRPNQHEGNQNKIM